MKSLWKNEISVEKRNLGERRGGGEGHWTSVAHGRLCGELPELPRFVGAGQIPNRCPASHVRSGNVVS